jgi:hypothetical protein
VPRNGDSLEHPFNLITFFQVLPDGYSKYNCGDNRLILFWGYILAILSQEKVVGGNSNNGRR